MPEHDMTEMPRVGPYLPPRSAIIPRIPLPQLSGVLAPGNVGAPVADPYPVIEPGVPMTDDVIADLDDDRHDRPHTHLHDRLQTHLHEDLDNGVSEPMVAAGAVGATGGREPAQLLPMRGLELLMPFTQVAIACASVLRAAHLFVIWRRVRDEPYSGLPERWLDQLDIYSAVAFGAGLAGGIVMIMWTVVAAINGRRITLFAPHWLPIVLGWSLGPALMAYGARQSDDHRAAYISIGFALMGMAMLVSVVLLRKVAEIVVGNGSPLNQWLIMLVLGAASSSWLTTRAVGAADTPSFLRDSAIATTLDVAIRLALAFFAFRAARHLREGFRDQRRVLRAGATIEARPETNGIALISMERPRILILFGVVLLTAATMAVSIIVVSHGDDGLTLLGERLRMLRYAVIGVGAMVFVGVAWWTMAVGVNAARLDGDRSPWWTASTCFGWWLFLPGAVYVDATTSGWQAVVGVGLMSVVAMYGHARLAGLARCYDMRYVAWGLLVFRVAAAVAGLLQLRDDDLLLSTTERVDGASWSTYMIGVLVSGLLVLVLVIRVGRSLQRIEAAVRKRKDALAPDPFLSSTALSMFNPTP